MFKYVCLLIFSTVHFVKAIDDDNFNSLLKNPKVQCGDDHFEVLFSTSHPFKGIVFVQGFLDDPNCRTNKIQTNDPYITKFRIPFSNCGIGRNISMKRNGVIVTVPLIVAFHPDYLTKYDRFYNVQCYYKEMVRYLEREVTVKMKPPTMQTKQLKMPTCKYEVLDGSPFGPPVFYATVGQPVYHKWSCETDDKNTFCMTVHSCFAENKKNERVPLLDEHGCALDKYLLSNLEYPSDLVAGREAHVYKYADQDQILFDCQISLRLKPLYAEYCDIPNCPDPSRKRRHDMFNATKIDLNNSTNSLKEIEVANLKNWINKRYDNKQETLCVEKIELSGILGMNAVLVICSIGIICEALLSYRYNFLQ